MPAVLGIDSSTQSTKVEVRDQHSGQVLGQGRGAHPPTSPPRSEQDPNAWWDALKEALSQVSDLLGDVAAVSVAGQQHGLVILDGDGGAIRPAKLWNDTESAPQAAALTDEMGARWWAETMGVVPVASFTLTKLAWLAQNEPDRFSSIASVMLPHDYLTFRLTGRRVTDRGDASGTAWWSPVLGAYVPAAIEAAGLPSSIAQAFPEVLAPLEAAGPIIAEDIVALGVPSSAVVAPGTGDNMAGALGIGLDPGDVAVSIGTSGTAYAVCEHAVADPTGLVAGFADATGRYLPLIATLNAVKVTNWVAELINRGVEDLADIALDAPSGSGGVTVVPYFDGERTPNLPDSSGTICGLRTATRPAEFVRAAHEGVVCSLLEGVDAIAAAGVPIDGRILLVGGGARSAAYQQIVAELSALPVVVPDADEAVASGACVQAAAVVEQCDPITIAKRWELGTGRRLAPGGDEAGVRERFRQVRDDLWMTGKH